MILIDQQISICLSFQDTLFRLLHHDKIKYDQRDCIPERDSIIIRYGPGFS